MRICVHGGANLQPVCAAMDNNENNVESDKAHTLDKCKLVTINCIHLINNHSFSDIFIH